MQGCISSLTAYSTMEVKYTAMRHGSIQDYEYNTLQASIIVRNFLFQNDRRICFP